MFGRGFIPVLVERLVAMANLALAVVSVLALRIVVTEDEPEPLSLAYCGQEGQVSQPNSENFRCLFYYSNFRPFLRAVRR